MHLSFLSTASHSAARARLLRADSVVPVRSVATPREVDPRTVEGGAQPSQGIRPIEDSVQLSGAALEALARSAPAAFRDDAEELDTENGTEDVDGERATGATEALSDEEQQQVRELRARDAEVRAHEAAHAAAAGSLAQGGASFELERGPDGASYAVGGEVQIEVGAGHTPEERLANAEQAQRAANAPASPSGADRAVAAQAAQVAADARNELREARQEESQQAQPQQAQPQQAQPQQAQPQRAEAYSANRLVAEAAPRLMATFG